MAALGEGSGSGQSLIVTFLSTGLFIQDKIQDKTRSLHPPSFISFILINLVLIELISIFGLSLISDQSSKISMVNGKFRKIVVKLVLISN